MLTLDDIRIYPVKGLRGFSVRAAQVEPWGLRHDRRWMVVDPAGKFLTQRQIPRMAAITADLVPGGLRLSADGAGAWDEATPEGTAPAIEVSVWSDHHVPAVEASAPASDWLTRTLRTPCRLVYMADPASARPTDPDFSEAADRVSFADGFPLLATTGASLDDLNRSLVTPVGMDRFRPNIVIGGGRAWAEDDWGLLRIGAAEFAVVKDCARCVVTTVDQVTGVKAETGEPLRALARFRRKARGRIIFGQNLVPRVLGSITVGDPLVILA